MFWTSSSSTGPYSINLFIYLVNLIPSMELAERLQKIFMIFHNILSRELWIERNPSYSIDVHQLLVNMISCNPSHVIDYETAYFRYLCLSKHITLIYTCTLFKKIQKGAMRLGFFKLLSQRWITNLSQDLKLLTQNIDMMRATMDEQHPKGNRSCKVLVTQCSTLLLCFFWYPAKGPGTQERARIHKWERNLNKREESPNKWEKSLHKREEVTYSGSNPGQPGKNWPGKEVFFTLLLCWLWTILVFHNLSP